MKSTGEVMGKDLTMEKALIQRVNCKWCRSKRPWYSVNDSE
ncbi:Uncharacterised protein [Staphylococcus gallinarum]|uniref:Uncharacterized protein n=1 Tax=Staphylococcus gallinarum TaxID=1293 RepID=A0A380FFW2_STAGA|nr:Uncharacterised protein [Staphylococcus gallinarum]